MKKILLWSVMGVFISSVVSAQSDQIVNQIATDGVSEVHFAGPDGNVLFSFVQNEEGAVILTDHGARDELDTSDLQDTAYAENFFESTRKIIGEDYQIVVYNKNDALKITLIDAHNNQTLYTVTGTAQNVSVYDSSNHLIAEGNPQKMKVYNERAFADFKRIIEGYK